MKTLNIFKPGSSPNLFTTVAVGSKRPCEDLPEKVRDYVRLKVLSSAKRGKSIGFKAEP